MTATRLASAENQAVDSNAINDSCREGLQPCATSVGILFEHCLVIIIWRVTATAVHSHFIYLDFS